LINFTLFFVQCIFYALGLLMSVVIPKIKSVIAITLTTVFTFFILDMFNAVVKDEKLRYILPYKYFDPMYILSHHAYEMVFLLITVLFVVVAISVTYVFYRKKDFLV
ncbi:MAG: ABC transporter permease, partial [Caldisericia bacterium]|nr:ABC transporter permease [Caldisericia bacterium]